MGAALSLMLTLQRGGPQSLQFQITDQLRQLMLNGQLGHGDRLPASRVLATDLGVSRNTVVAAYEQLRSEGFLESRQGDGTRIVELPEAASFSVHAERNPGRSRVAHPNGGSGPAGPDAVPPLFETGLPDVSEFPRREWARVVGRVFRYAGDDLLTPNRDAGEAGLRRALARHLGETRGIRCEPHQVIITNGAQAGLDLVMRILPGDGSRCLVEDPCWPGFHSVARFHRVTMVPVGLDDQGFSLDRARENLPAGMIFVTPSYQFPLGITMSLERRLALLEFAARNGCRILEDDYDSDLRYRGKPLAALRSLDRSGQVIYTGTFSKAMFPPLRIGYVVVPEETVGRFSDAIRSTGQQPSPLLQRALAEFIDEGLFARHLRRMRKLYRQKQEAVVSGLSDHAGDRLELTGGDAGMQLVAWLRHPQDREALRSRLMRGGIAAHLISDYYHGPCAREGLFLGYAAIPMDRIDAACRQLARCLG